jgi:hypothetical protein
MRRLVAADLWIDSTSTEPCSYDDQLDATVHRFDLGARTCRCNSVTVLEPLKPRGLGKYGHAKRPSGDEL